MKLKLPKIPINQGTHRAIFPTKGEMDIARGVPKKLLGTYDYMYCDTKQYEYNKTTQQIHVKRSKHD